MIADPAGFDDDEPHVVVGRAPRHRPGGAGRRGQRVRSLGAARARPDGRGAATRTAGAVHRLRGRGAARVRRRTAPLRLPAARRRAVPGGASRDPGGGRAGPGRRPGRRTCRSARPDRAATTSAATSAARPAGRRPHPGLPGNTTSDHWSYAKAGIPAIRLGSIPYAGYHSRADTPDVVDRRQLDRVGTLMWAWLRTR